MIKRERIIIKWGGGLITNKSLECSPNLEIIKSLAEVITKIHDFGLDIILVHGAGSFGHLKAKKYRLHEGKLNDDFLLLDSESDYLTQEEAVEVVRNDMLSLNSIIINELMNLGIKCKSFPPHIYFSETGPDFIGNLNNFDLIPEGEVAITFGDVVNCDNELKFGILSGDDIVKRLAIELSNVKRVIFAIGGVDGLLLVPPDKATKDDLISVWCKEMSFEGKHYSDIDVTGGIFLKADRGAMIADYNIDVRVVNGAYSHRVYSASIGEDFYGTRIISKTHQYKKE